MSIPATAEALRTLFPEIPEPPTDRGAGTGRQFAAIGTAPTGSLQDDPALNAHLDGIGISKVAAPNVPAGPSALEAPTVPNVNSTAPQKQSQGSAPPIAPQPPHHQALKIGDVLAQLSNSGNSTENAAAKTSNDRARGIRA